VFDHAFVVVVLNFFLFLVGLRLLGSALCFFCFFKKTQTVSGAASSLRRSTSTFKNLSAPRTVLHRSVQILAALGVIPPFLIQVSLGELGMRFVDFLGRDVPGFG
jgi:hypothetical protein